MSGTSTSKVRPLSRLAARLNYQFRDLSLLEQALTHKSHSRKHYERLEFLGDAVLGHVIADALYREHPDLAEDALTLFRADLVRKETLAEVARSLGLGEYLKLGVGERKSGGRQRESILADALEAIIGAVSLDGGQAAANSLVLFLFENRILDTGERGVSKDAKTRLQELLQGQALDLPVYEVVATSGSEHERTFTVRCSVEVFSLHTTGRGPSRRAAEKSAAEAMISEVEAHE